MTGFRIPRSPRGERAFFRPVGDRGEVLELESEVLRNNPLGDSPKRRVAVMRPPSGKTDGTPLLVLLPGFGGSGPAELGGSGLFQENLFQLFDRLQRSGACGEAVLASPDCTTALGGNQYVNSSAVGRYDDFVVGELVPWLQERYRTTTVGVLGQSSGGFGALHLAFEHPGRFEAVGSSAGDMGFEYAFLADLATACREFQRHGGPEQFLSHLFEDGSVLQGPSHPSGAALVTLAAAASYSARDDEPGTFDLPCDWATSELIPEVWARWKRFDPVFRVGEPTGAEALRKARLVCVTGSRADEWRLDQGARWFTAVARRHQVPVVHEEFDGGHFVRRPRFGALFLRLVAALRGDALPAPPVPPA